MLELDTTTRYEIRSPSHDHRDLSSPGAGLSPFSSWHQDQQPRYRCLASQIFTLSFIISGWSAQILCKILSRILELTNALTARTHRRRIVPPHPFCLRIGGAKGLGGHNRDAADSRNCRLFMQILAASLPSFNYGSDSVCGSRVFCTLKALENLIFPEKHGEGFCTAAV